MRLLVEGVILTPFLGWQGCRNSWVKSERQVRCLQHPAPRTKPQWYQ